MFVLHKIKYMKGYIKKDGGAIGHPLASPAHYI